LFKKITSGLEGFNKFIEAVGNVCIWGMFAIIFINTALRMFFGYSFPWAEEISKLLMVWMALLVSATLCFYESRHVALTFLFEKLRPRAQIVALLIFNTLTLVFSLILANSGYWYVYDNLKAVLPASGLPRWLLYLPLPLGGVILALFSAYMIWKRILQLKGTVPYEIKTGEEE